MVRGTASPKTGVSARKQKLNSFAHQTAIATSNPVNGFKCHILLAPRPWTKGRDYGKGAAMFSLPLSPSWLCSQVHEAEKAELTL